MINQKSSDQVFDMLEAIAGTSGHVKKRLLDESMIPYLQAAYNPYWMYYLKSCAPGSGVKEFDQETWNILDDLRARRLSGQLAQDIVNMHTQNLTKKSAELFRRILNKDLRIGMAAKMINSVYDIIPTHAIMLAKLFDENKIKFPCWGSPKIDGVRAVYKFGEFYSRNGHKYEGLDHLKHALREIKTPMDGELIVRGKTFQEGSGLIRRNTPTPDAEFHVFELPTIKEDFPTRITLMDDLQMQFTHVHPVLHMKLKDLTELHKFYSMCRSQGFEGSVIKTWDYKYKNSRSYDWMKMKAVETLDLVIIDTFEGQGKYEGQLGGVIVDFRGKPVKVGSGFSDADRVYLWNKRETTIGRTAEVHFMEITDTQSLRHPRFVTFRPDK